MSYQVSARKWRPQVFEEVIGQGHITQTLQNAIRSGRVAHAYLFSGERGVGKTTMARIFAKALNCEKGPTVDPCNQCVVCQEITRGMAVDVIEIDGASNTGVDDVRELREAVKYVPVRGKYKVYIIDEVHMLSTSAFNALLKTLEEPPERVIFLFATTELEKIPTTILSRCQHFTFKRIPQEAIVQQLQRIAAEEKITIEDGGLALIARASGGSMRDALSLMDQAAAYGGQVVRVDELRGVLGVVNQQILLTVTRALYRHQPSEVLALVKELVDNGYDIRQFVAELVEHVRNLLVVKVAQDPFPLVELPREELELLMAEASHMVVDELQRLLALFVHAQMEIKSSPSPRFTLELTLVKATQMARTQPLEELLRRLTQMEQRLKDGLVQQSQASDSPPAKEGGLEATAGSGDLPATRLPAAAGLPDRQGQAGIGGITAPRPPPISMVQPVQGGEKALPSSGEEVGGDMLRECWGVIVKQVKEEKPNLGSYLEQGVVVECTHHTVTIGYPESASFLLKLVQKEEHIRVLRRIMEQVFKKSLAIRWFVLDPSKSPPNIPQQGEGQKENGGKKRLVGETPLLREALTIFGGEVIDSKEE